MDLNFSQEDTLHKHIVERVLLTNDDGIDAPGLKILQEASSTLAREVWVVAPAHDRSGVSHSISLHDPLRVTTRDARTFAVSGTPADCVVLAVNELMDGPPDLVLSGINRGSNLGVETVFSGTVGAAMTGMLLGLRSVALSQVFTSPNPIRWETAAALAPKVLREMAQMRWPDGCCLNVNFPDAEPTDTTRMIFTEQGTGLMEGLHVTKKADPRNQNYFWLHINRGAKKDSPLSETTVVLDGNISITPLQFERTNLRALSFLRKDI